MVVRLELLAAVLLLIGCETTPQPMGGATGGSSTGAMPPAESRTEDPAVAAQRAEDMAKKAEEEKAEALKKAKNSAKRAKLVRDLDIAESKLGKATIEAQHQGAANDEEVRKTTSSFEMAVKKLEDFNLRSAPLRVDRARLSLRRAEDRVQESQEELQQLEMMYSEEELGDKTAEIVLVRSKRRLDRARWDLNIQKQSLENLEGETIPLERLELEFAVRDKQEVVEAKKRSAQMSDLTQMIAVMTAESEVKRVEAERRLLELEE